jgi:hypothetical protein
MKRFATALFSCCAVAAHLSTSAASAALLRYEPFNYNDVGTTLTGKINPDGAEWFRAGAQDPNSFTVASGSLVTPSPLTPAVGNSLNIKGIGNNAGSTDRLALGQTISAAGSTVYYSMALRFDASTGSNNGNGGFFAGLNSATGLQTTNPTVIAARLYGRIDPNDATKYNLTIARARDLTVNFPAAGWSGPLAEGSTVFIVGSYEIVDGANNDIARIWVNPSPSTFADPLFSPVTTPPTITDATTANGSDPASLQSFLLRQSAAPWVTVDEIRVGTDWASVTPIVPEPASMALAVVGLGMLVQLRRRAVELG